MSKLLILAVVILAVAAAGAYFLLNKPTSYNPSLQKPADDNTSSFATPKKAAHWESNTPEHGSTLAALPVNVVINFNFDLAPPSEIKIQKDDKEYDVSQTIIDENNLAMRKNMDPSAPDGIYAVNYKACWADGSCHDGSFEFKIDRGSSASFTDMTDKSEVTIDLANFAFTPQKVKVSKGTTVTWVNKDNVVHTVNTDSHPAHTYFPSQNSRDLANGETYSITFEEPGIYLYHCTPHADTMTGQILVE